MWGRGSGRDSQPSPTPGEGPITHEYRVIPTNYIYMLYIKRQEDQRDAERHNEVGWAWAFIHFFVHHSPRFSKAPAMYQDGGWGGNINRPRDRLRHSLPAIYLCTSVPNIVLNAESTEGRKSDFPNVFIAFTSCA